jgi:hypothetical protein
MSTPTLAIRQLPVIHANVSAIFIDERIGGCIYFVHDFAQGGEVNPECAHHLNQQLVSHNFQHATDQFDYRHSKASSDCVLASTAMTTVRLYGRSANSVENER